MRCKIDLRKGGEIMQFLKNFGNLVYAKRLALGYTQEELAEKVDICPRHVPNIEAGKCDLRLSLILRLAVCLDMDLNELKAYVECDENGNFRKDLLK